MLRFHLAALEIPVRHVNSAGKQLVRSAAIFIVAYISGGSVEAAETGVILPCSWQIVFASADVFPLIALKKVSRGCWSEIVACRVF